ncbi:MAG: DUF1080 domain-containing protein [Armatimonadota bacterium]
MERRFFLAGAAGLLLAAGFGAANAQEGRGFTKLYNGKDLSGWHAKDGKLEAWQANGELLSCVAPGGGWLTSDKEYGDFILRLEYRIGPGGNSGVGIRYPAQGDPAHVGMEIQILDDAAPQYKDLQPAQYNGGIYYQSAAKEKASKAPGEWNRYVIRAQGPNITVRLNGKEIQKINVEEFTKGEGGHKPLAERPRRGHVGLQSHGDRVDFRNIEIREL